MRRYILLTLFLLSHSLFAIAQSSLSQEEYIIKYKDLALASQEKYGIPASIKMAQGLLESAHGTSRLATEANNHFGIKCKSTWKGMSITHDDDEKGECFRKYKSAEDSFKDHSEFLDSSPRYQSLFELEPTDYKGWANGLKAAGYATNPKYPELLIAIIDKFELHSLDTDKKVAQSVEQAAKDRDKKLIAQATQSLDKINPDNYTTSLRKNNEHSIYANNGSEFIIIKSGESLESISKSFKLSVKKLIKYNDLPKDTKNIEPGSQLYIKTKASRSINGKLIHSSSQGETLWGISQRYGIKLSKLSSMNKLNPGAKLHEGQQIRLM